MTVDDLFANMDPKVLEILRKRAEEGNRTPQVFKTCKKVNRRGRFTKSISASKNEEKVKKIKEVAYYEILGKKILNISIQKNRDIEKLAAIVIKKSQKVLEFLDKNHYEYLIIKKYKDDYVIKRCLKPFYDLPIQDQYLQSNINKTLKGLRILESNLDKFFEIEKKR